MYLRGEERWRERLEKNAKKIGKKNDKIKDIIPRPSRFFSTLEPGNRVSNPWLAIRKSY